MNKDITYDGHLLDLLSLMQSAIIRLLSHQPIDIHKLTHYFTSIYKRMETLEQNFHNESKKVSKYVTKLKNFLNKEEQKTSLGTSNQKNKNACDQPIQPPIVNSKVAYHSVYGSRELKSIQEEEEQHQSRNHPSKRRSQTANGYRQKFFENTRPMTGEAGRNRYKNKTIEIPTNPLTQQPQRYEVGGERGRQLYEQLKKLKDQEDKNYSTISYNLPFRKKSHSQQKWSHKISRLL